MIDPAIDLFPDVPLKGNTAGGYIIRPLHVPEEVVQFFRHDCRYSTPLTVIRLGPVKGCPVKGAAGAAAHAGVTGYADKCHAVTVSVI